MCNAPAMSRREWSAAAVALAAVFGLHVWWLRGLAEDAFISFRYGRHLAAGHGLVWNLGGPPVEGYTNFLWVLMAAAFDALGVDVPGAAQAELLGLPEGVTAKPVEIDTTSESITFRVTAGKTAAIGLHKTLFCRVSIPWRGAGGRKTTVVQRLGLGGQLRILDTATGRQQEKREGRGP